MLRDKSLIPLSHQHQHALALCVRLDRAIHAGEVDVEAWQSEIQQVFENEIACHFAAEEKEVFPVARRFSKLEKLVKDLLSEHTTLRDFFSRAANRQLDTTTLAAFVEQLAHHIRKEERELFEGLQKVMPADELAAMGTALVGELTKSHRSCSLQNPATRLRPKP